MDEMIKYIIDFIGSTFNFIKYNDNLITSLIKSNTRIKLQKENIVSNFTVFSTPKIIVNKNQSVDISRFNNVLSELIVDFVEYLNNNYSSENLNLLYRNLKTLKVCDENTFRFIKNKIRLKLIGGIYAGSYSPVFNRIIIIDPDDYKHKIFNLMYMKQIMYHELLHMSSTVMKKDIIFSGFSQIMLKGGKKYGIGINEGYTDLLMCRMFDKKENETGYSEEFEVVKNIEKLVGKDNMIRLYFSANLDGLISELSKYNSVYNVKKFILDLDLISKYKSNIKINISIDEKNIEEVKNRIIHFLVCSFREKLVNDFENGRISEKEFLVKSKQLLLNFNKENINENDELGNNKNGLKM